MTEVIDLAEDKTQELEIGSTFSRRLRKLSVW